MLKKAGVSGSVKDFTVPDMCESEYALVSELGRFAEVVKSAAEKYEPSFITRYAIDLAQAFSKFYIDCKIACEDENLRNFRLALTDTVKTVLINALTLLGIDYIEEM